MPLFTNREAWRRNGEVVAEIITTIFAVLETIHEAFNWYKRQNYGVDYVSAE